VSDSFSLVNARTFICKEDPPFTPPLQMVGVFYLFVVSVYLLKNDFYLSFIFIFSQGLYRDVKLKMSWTRNPCEGLVMAAGYVRFSGQIREKPRS